MSNGYDPNYFKSGQNMADNPYGGDMYDQPEWMQNFSWGNVLDWGKDKAQDIKEGIQTGAENVKEGVVSGVNTVRDTASGVYDTVTEGASNLYDRAMEGVKNFNIDADKTRADNLKYITDQTAGIDYTGGQVNYANNNKPQTLGDDSLTKEILDTSELGSDSPYNQQAPIQGPQNRNPYSGHLTDPTEVVPPTVDGNTVSTPSVNNQTTGKSVGQGFNENQMQIPNYGGNVPVGVRPEVDDAIVQNNQVENVQDKGQNTDGPFSNWSLKNIGSFNKTERHDENEFLEDGTENPNYKQFITDAKGNVQYDEDEGLGIGGKPGGFMSKFGTGEGFLSNYFGKGGMPDAENLKAGGNRRETTPVEVGDAYEYKSIF